MFPEKLILSVADYLIFGLTLAISAGIGLFFQFFSKKNTNDEYLLGGKDMSLIPVIISLMATFMSATTIMGIPAEMYLYGTHMAFMNIGFILGPIISVYVFLPIYFTNNLSTVYEYLEKRFGKSMRTVISAMFVLQVGLFTSVTLYAPALALSAVTNLSTWSSIITIGSVCTFYCTLGGIKAVIWADVFQAILMYVCLITIIIKGSIDMGGLGNILNISNEGGRLLIPKFSMDMTEQYSLINIFLQSLIITTSTYCGSQIHIQRLRTVKNISRSRRASFWSILFTVSFHLLCCLCGLIFYAYFRDCDPLTSPNQPIHSADQLMPFYITSSMSNFPGLPGLCIAGIFSASLSTVSSILNSLASVTIEDFIKPIWPSASQNVFWSKITSFIFGVLCICFSFLMASMGNLVRMALIIYGMIAGPNLGVFILAACTKKANEKGSMFGVVAGVVVAVFLSFLPNGSLPPYLPVSNECPDYNFSSFEISQLSKPDSLSKGASAESTIGTKISENRPFISISYMWISSIALLITLIVGYLGSIIFEYFEGPPKELPNEYLSPVRIWFSRRKSEKGNITTDRKITSISEKILQGKTQYESSI